MSRPPRRYRRLPGIGRHPFGSHQLWLAEGHLLLVNDMRYRETYRRVELADVQALVVCRTRRLPIRLVLLALTLAPLAPLPFVPLGGQVTFGVVAGLFLAALLVELARGPGCRVALRTPVQVLRLRSLTRWRAAQKVADQLAPLVVAVQGSIPRDELGLDLDQVQPLPLSPPSVWTEVLARQPARPYGGGLHRVLAGLLLVLAGLGSGLLSAPSVWLAVATGLVGVAGVGVAAAACIRQRSGDLPVAARRWAWLSLAWLASLGPAAWSVFMLRMMVSISQEAVAALALAALLVTAALVAVGAVLEVRRARVGGG